MNPTYFATESCGRPKGADSIPWLEERQFRRYRPVLHRDAVRWEGTVEAKLVGRVDSDPVYRLGIGGSWRYRLPDGRTFIWRYAYGSPYGFDAAEIILEG